MSTVGEYLREAREAKGLTIAELAKKTHIMSKQLEGIERDDFSPIPAPIYVKSFIKTFATQVGLDPAEMVALYLEQMKAGANPPAPTPELKVKQSARTRKEQARAEKAAAKEAAREQAREAAEQAAREAEAAKVEKAARKQVKAAKKAELAAKRKSSDPAGLMPIVPSDEVASDELPSADEVAADDLPAEEEATGIAEHQELLDFGDGSNDDTTVEDDDLVEVDLDELDEDAQDDDEDVDELDEVEDVEIEAPASASSVKIAAAAAATAAAAAATASAATPKSAAAKTSASPQNSASANALRGAQTWQRPVPKPSRPARPPRPSMSAVLAEKWKGVKAAFGSRFKRSESGFSIFGKTIAAATLRKAATMLVLACCLAGLVYAAVLVADRMELRRAERGSSIGDLRTNPVITDPPDPYFITE